MCQMHGLREEKRKVTFRIGENEIEFDFVFIKKEHSWYIQNVKKIDGEFQHALVMVIADIEKKLSEVVKKVCAERRKISLLKDVKIRKRLEQQQQQRLEVCGKKRERRSKGDTWWWNEEVKETISRKKDAHKAMSHNGTEENKMKHKGIQKKLFQKQ